jgi:hypothetical protein
MLETQSVNPITIAWFFRSGPFTYRRSVNNSNGLNNLLLVHLRAGTVKITDDGSHTSFITHGSGQMDGLLRVILGEAGQGLAHGTTNLPNPHPLISKMCSSWNGLTS